jgi:hypothetical protein
MKTIVLFYLKKFQYKLEIWTFYWVHARSCNLSPLSKKNKNKNPITFPIICCRIIIHCRAWSQSHRNLKNHGEWKICERFITRIMLENNETNTLHARVFVSDDVLATWLSCLKPRHAGLESGLPLYDGCWLGPGCRVHSIQRRPHYLFLSLPAW